MHETRNTPLNKGDPACWTPSKSTFDVSSITPTSSTCLDCVQPGYALSEITSLCTDKCVVIACNNPDHGDISCHRAGGNPHCDLVCDGATNCNDCTGFDEFLQCCTNYHSGIAQPQSAPTPWDSLLDNFLCACGEEGQGASKMAYVPLDPFASTEMDMSYMPAANNVSHSPSSSSFVTDQTSEVACMWGNCQARFASLSDLVGHVNFEHLRLPPAPAPASLSAVPEIQPDSSPLSCLWRDCTVYSTPESIPTSSSSNPVDGLLNILANHLLEDHIGQQLPATASEDNSLTFSTTQANANQQNCNQTSPSSGTDRSTSPLSFLSHQCSGTHMCNWKSCGQSFTTCSDLTSHITAAHIGGGKAHYECFWEGCNRNGSNGFSSKQKISRHLQSHTGHRPYQCEVCFQNFSEAATLQQHMRRHTQEKPYKCDYPGCGKSFAITGALTIHKRMHNGHKPFKCKFCDRAFAESSNLSKHLRTHTGARPYPCMEPGCNKSFARPDQLSRHMGVHRKGNSVDERME